MLKNMAKGHKGFQKGEIPKTAFKKGNKHPLWKDGQVGYSSLHEWIAVNWGKAKEYVCELCPKRALDWANKTNTYDRNRENWMTLCRSCHKKYDKADTSKARETLAAKRKNHAKMASKNRS